MADANPRRINGSSSTTRIRIERRHPQIQPRTVLGRIWLQASLEISDSCGNPAPDVGEDSLLADVVEHVVEVALIELQRFVGAAGMIEEELAAARLGRLVLGAMQDEHRHGDLAKRGFEPVV